MSFKLDPHVEETSTTTGTGAFALTGVDRRFGDFLSNGDTTWYQARNNSVPAEWEEGIATWNTGHTLTRTTVLNSSNADAAVNFSAGTKTVICGLPSAIFPSGSILGTIATQNANAIALTGPMTGTAATFSDNLTVVMPSTDPYPFIGIQEVDATTKFGGLGIGFRLQNSAATPTQVDIGELSCDGYYDDAGVLTQGQIYFYNTVFGAPIFYVNTDNNHIIIASDVGDDDGINDFQVIGSARIEEALTVDARINLKSYTVATLPAAGVAGGVVYVSNAAVAPCVAFSNGTNWKRCDNAATTVI